MRLKLIVVEIARPFDPARNSLKSSIVGALSGLAMPRRCGTEPPRASRLALRYFISGLSSAGRKKGASLTCASEIGMLKRVRNSLSWSSLSFLLLCVMLRPSPASPSP